MRDKTRMLARSHMIRFAGALALCALAAPAPVAGQNSPADAFVAWGRAHLHQLRTVEPAGATSDLDPLRKMIGTSRAVLVGEPAHGWHEPLAFRNRLFRYLVETAGFRAIALETGAPESAGLQAYIDGGDGNATEVARRYFTWGFGDFKENAELIEWMRSYNRSARTAQRLKIYGIDLSGVDEMPDAERLERALASPRAWLRRYDSDAATRTDVPLAASLAQLQRASRTSLAPAERNGLSANISDLIAELERHQASKAARADNAEFQRALRDANVARQLDGFWRAMPPPDSTVRGLSPLIFRPITARDRAMADNTHWVMRQEGVARRVMVFAHDSHVMNSVITGGLSRVFTTPPAMLGAYLRTMFGKELFIVGTYAAGREGAGGANPVDTLGMDAALSRLGRAPFVLGLRDAPLAGPVHTWLHDSHSMRVNITMSLDIVPAVAFDALVYLGALTAAHK